MRIWQTIKNYPSDVYEHNWVILCRSLQLLSPAERLGVTLSLSCMKSPASHGNGKQLIRGLESRFNLIRLDRGSQSDVSPNPNPFHRLKNCMLEILFSSAVHFFNICLWLAQYMWRIDLENWQPSLRFKVIKSFLIPTTYVCGKVAEWSKASDLSLMVYMLLCVLLVNPRSRKRQGFEPLSCHFFFFDNSFSYQSIIHTYIYIYTYVRTVLLLTLECLVFSSSFYLAWESLLGGAGASTSSSSSTKMTGLGVKFSSLGNRDIHETSDHWVCHCSLDLQ